MEHNGKVLGESLDLVKYIDDNFEGPSLVPSVRTEYSSSLCISIYCLARSCFEKIFFFFFQDPAKKEFGEKLISYVDTFTKELYSALKGDPIQQASKYGFGFMNRGKSCLSPYEINLQNWGF